MFASLYKRYEIFKIMKEFFGEYFEQIKHNMSLNYYVEDIKKTKEGKTFF